MTVTVSKDELIERLRDEATRLSGAAWSRPDGGQDACIASNLANEAADRIAADAAKIASLETERAQLRSRETQEPTEAWQPIETAPKDGTWQVVAHFDSKCFYFWHRARFLRGKWRTGNGVVIPSHWLPLPPAMLSAAQQGDG